MRLASRRPSAASSSVTGASSGLERVSSTGAGADGFSASGLTSAGGASGGSTGGGSGVGGGASSTGAGGASTSTFLPFFPADARAGFFFCGVAASADGTTKVSAAAQARPSAIDERCLMRELSNHRLNDHARRDLIVELRVGHAQASTEGLGHRRQAVTGGQVAALHRLTRRRVDIGGVTAGDDAAHDAALEALADHQRNRVRRVVTAPVDLVELATKNIERGEGDLVLQVVGLELRHQVLDVVDRGVRLRRLVAEVRVAVVVARERQVNGDDWGHVHLDE